MIIRTVILSLFVTFPVVCSVKLYIIDRDDPENIDITYSHYRDKRLSDTSELDEDSSSSAANNITDMCNMNSSTECVVDHHKYYKAVYINNNSSWIELSPEENPAINGTKHMQLSESSSKYGYADTLKMDNFLFYGLPIKNITMLTGGFLHVGAIRYTQYLTKIQYIAPFMGNFNPSLRNFSNVYYYSDADKFIVQWDKMKVDGREDLGNFTFQVQLYKNNYDIVFAYKELPLVQLSEDAHPNTVGVSDAYYIMSPNSVFLHAYHVLKINKTRLGNNTAVKLLHQKLCPMINDCYSCTTATLQDFECRWCSKLQQCSDRVGDSGFNDWHAAACAQNYKKAGQKCDEYCYYPTRDIGNTTYTPARSADFPVVTANSTGTQKVQVDCSPGYSVSVNYNLTARDQYACTSGGIDLPHCAKSCSYNTAPTNGFLLGARVGTLLKPDSIYAISCDLKHRTKNNAPKNVTCLDNGTLEPDPTNVRCEKYCTLPHPANARYYPTPQDSGFLHEGENTTLICDDNHALDDYLSGEFPNKTVHVSCQENTDLSTFAEKCVPFCLLNTHPNTTYTPAIPRINDTVAITCANGTALQLPSGSIKYTCLNPGLLKLPACTPLQHLQIDTSSSSSLTILLVFFTLVVMAILCGWFLYAYKNPTSPSGLFLIEKCRPWTWRSHTYSRHQESLGESYYLDGGI